MLACLSAYLASPDLENDMICDIIRLSHFSVALISFFFPLLFALKDRPTFIRLVTLDSLLRLLSSPSLLFFPFLSFLYFPLRISLSDTAVVVVILAVSFHRDYAHCNSRAREALLSDRPPPRRAFLFS